MKLALLALVAGCSHGSGTCKPAVKLELHRVTEGDPAMQKIYAHVQPDIRTSVPADPAARDAGVNADVDLWRDDAGRTHTDYFLKAANRAAIEKYTAALPAELQLPKDHVLAFEHTDQGYRTYYIEAATALDVHATSAKLAQEHHVDVGLDAAGKKAFEELTGKMVGHKLATLVDGEVASAPIIASAITGGHFWIKAASDDAAKKLLSDLHCD